MRTTITLPDDIFEGGERLADRLRTSRSRLYARALAAFIARHDEDTITAAFDRAIDRIDERCQKFVQEAVRRQLREVEYEVES